MKKKKERGLELMTGLLAGSILAMSEALAAAGVSAGQTDNFQDGTSAGWENGQSCNEDNISTGGPAGNGDGYIRVSSPAVRCGHTDSKLVTLNRTRWTGDYSGQGVKQISMDLKNFGSAALPIRIAIREGTGGSGTPGYCSTAVSVPNDGQWHNYSFSLDGSMSPINSPQPLATDLANVQELRILSSAQPSLSGDAISAQIGIDNITAKGAAPSISGQPQSQPSAHVGENISFSVTASSAPAASYQWSKNGAPLSNGGNISGATSSSLSLNNIQTSDSGSYDVVVSNPYGSTPSQTASLTVQAAAPTITSFGPLNPAVLPGQSVQFTVLASGTQPFTYEWQFNDQDIPNAPSQDTYTVSSLPANIGNYRVIVHNSAGQATSVESRPTLLSLLTVGPTLGGIVNPGSSAYSQGSRVTLTAMPYPGWAFSGWSGDASGNANPLTITMDSAKSVQANFANPGNACFDVLSGVTHWWSGEGNANDLMGAAHGTASGVTYSAGNTGQAFNFNGDSAYLDLGNDAGTFKAYGFTIEFWIKVPSTITRQEEVLCKRSTCNLNTSFWDIYNDSSGHPIFEMVDDAGHHLSLPLSKAVNDGTWHYVVFARDGRTLYGYLDGLLDSTLDSGVHLNVSPGAALLAGTGPCVGSDRSAFSGALDEITLYEGTTLWPTAIAAIYQNGKCRGVVTPPLPGLIAWWPLENEPGYVNDIISGNNAIGISQHDGRVGEAFELPAVAPLIFPSSSSLTVPSAFTVEAWVWDQSLGSFDNILSKANDSGQYIYRLMLNAGKVGLQVFGNGPGPAISVLTASAVVPRKTWTHIVAQYSAITGFAGIYVNGTLQPLTYSVFGTPQNFDGNGPFALGYRYDGPPPFGGALDEVALYNRQLSEDEIKALYYIGGTAGKAALKPPSIITQPASQTVTAGAYVTFSVVTRGIPFYQWRFNGVDIAGATTSSLDLYDVQCTDAGAYSVMAHNGFFPPVTSAAANLTVIGQATLSASVVGGGHVASSPDLPCYPLGTTVILQAAPAAGWSFAGWSGDANDSAPYISVTMDRNKSITANFVSNVPDIIVDNSDSANVVFSTGWSLGNSLSGFYGSDYRYSQQSGNAISAQFSAQLPLTGNYDVDVIFPLSANGQTAVPYTVQGTTVSLSQNRTGGTWINLVSGTAFNQGVASVSLTGGSGLSPATTFADAVRWRWSAQQVWPPFITRPPQDQAVVVGGTATFTVSALGSGPLSYQWYQNGSLMSGKTDSTLTLPNVTASQDNNIYSVEVVDLFGVPPPAHAQAVLRVGTPPTIMTQPQNLSVGLGQPATFSVSASGTPPFYYQWSSNNVAVPGATGSSFTVADVEAPAYLSRYSAVVTNLFGAVASSAATLSITGAAPVILAQPQGQTMLAGGSVTLSVQATSPNPVSYQWRFNGVAIPGATDSSYTRGQLEPGGKIIAAGSFSLPAQVSRPFVGRLRADGSLDPLFAPAVNGAVNAVAVQPNGQILLAGAFTQLGGQLRIALGRVTSGGTLDSGFNPSPMYFPSPDETSVSAIAIQADGRILVGGAFTQLGGATRNFIGRLAADGSLDANFHPDIDGPVHSLAVDSNGRIVVGGSFSNLVGQPRPGLGRLNADGSLDSSFNPQVEPIVDGGDVLALRVQPDGKIVAGGNFRWLRCCGGPMRAFLARFNDDGSDDSGFNPGENVLNPGADGTVVALALQGDGKLLVGGGFSQLRGQTRYYIGRLNSDGTLDSAFNPGANDVVAALVVQSDGLALVGGKFTVLAGQALNHIGRLNADGSPDASYDPAADGAVNALALQADGSAIVGGVFSGFGALTRSPLVRLGSDGSMDASFKTEPTSDVQALAFQADRKLLVGAENFPPRLARLNRDSSRDTIFNPQPYSGVGAFALQADGKILIGEGLGQAPPNYVVRLGPDGAVDNSFNSGVSIITLALAIQSDGKVLVGGERVTNGPPLARLNSDGGLDHSFNPTFDPPSATVYALALQPDGKLLVGGLFSAVNGSSITNLVRLDANGVVDTTFNPGPDALVQSLVVQPDGAVLIGGAFRHVSGQNQGYLARLTSGGGLDSSFMPVLDGRVFSIALEPDARIIVAGDFSTLTGSPRRGIGRLEAGGSTDNSFSSQVTGVSRALPEPSDFGDYTVTVGDFSTTVTSAVARVDQLLPPTVASSFNGVGDNASDPAYSTSWSSGQNGGTGFGPWTLETSGSGGFFVGDSSVNGGSSNINTSGNKAWGIYANSGALCDTGRRLTAPLLPGQTLKLDMHHGHINTAAENGSFGGVVDFSLATDVGTGLSFSGGGGEQEYMIHVFGGSGGGSTYGTGIPLTDGGLHFEFSLFSGGSYSLMVATNGRFAGQFTGTLSGSGQIAFIELENSNAGETPPRAAFFNSLQISTPVVQVGAATSFTVTTSGGAPTSYQWLRNGVPIAGATTATYTIASAQAADSGSYSLVLANVAGSTTNPIGTLAVITDNSWLSATDGKWEDTARWSLGFAPSSAQANVIVSKPAQPAPTVTIDGTTSTYFPGTMTIQNLHVGSGNTLYLNNAGENSPLTVLQNARIDGSGQIFILHSSLVADGNTYNDGLFKVLGSSFTGRSRVQVGTAPGASGQVIVTGGSFNAGELVMGPTADGTLLQVSSNGLVSITGASSQLLGERIVQDGGAIEAFDSKVCLGLGRTSSYSMTGGVLVAKELCVGHDGLGRMTNSGGIVLVSSNLVVGDESGGAGTLALNAGTVIVAAADGSGQRSKTSIGQSGSGELRLNGGVLAVEDFFATNGTQSAITFNGGTLDCSGSLVVSNSQPLQVGDNSHPATLILGSSSPSAVSCANGLVVCTNSSLAVVQGSNTFSGSILNCGSINVSSAAVAQFADAVTNYGVLAVGSAGASFTGTVVNYGTIAANESGSVDLYGPVINNGIISQSNGAVHFYSTVTNNGILPAPTLTTAFDPLSAALTVSWPSAFAGFVVQVKSSLSATSAWSTYAGAISEDGTNKSVTVPHSGGNLFFRLGPASTNAPMFIPPGNYVRGNSSGDGGINGAPVYSVSVSGFSIESTLVTSNKWSLVAAYAAAHGYTFDFAGAAKGAAHPVMGIDWFDTVKWCNARSEMEGLAAVYYADPGLTTIYRSGQLAPFVNGSAGGYRLPTEAEWEKAARGGLAGKRFPWGDTITNGPASSGGLADYYGYTVNAYDFGPSGYNSAYNDGVVPYTSPVGSFPANGYGLYDMAGDVDEWCWDWYSSTYYGPGQTDPQGPGTGSYRVVRGGNWASESAYARTAYRDGYLPNDARTTHGFRCVRAP